MSERINCPFCGNTIEKDAYKCNKCDSFFADPELPGLKFKEFRTFVALLVLSFGLFGILWVLVNIKAINKLVINKKDSIKFNSLIIISVLDILAYLFCLALYQNAAGWELPAEPASPRGPR